MRHAPILKLDPYRLPNHGDGRIYRDNDGAYVIPHPRTGARLTVISSTGLEWDHVSVSLPNRCPTWEEMDYVCRLFFRDDETVMQLHVPPKDNINNHQFCLDLWRPQQQEIPRPPAICVGLPARKAR